MKSKVDRALIFSPQPGATPDEVMEVLKLVVFQSYPDAVRTRANLLALFDKLPEGAKRHFQVKIPQS